MPELPEVETYRRTLLKELKNKTIREVHVTPDPIIFVKRSPAFVKKTFLNAKVRDIKRKGKYLWFEMNQKIWPVFHLGMTGSYAVTNGLPEKKMKSVKLILEMSDGTFMIFKDPRRFGRIFLLEEPLKHRPLSELGPDVMNELPSANEFYKMLEARKAPIKAILLDQGTLSGIGNWMADEILYQSGIAPHRLGSTLSKNEIKKLHGKIKSVTELSVRVGANDEKYPKGWLFHHRWGKKGEKVSSGEDIRFSEVGGRTTAWVPEKQK